MHPDSGAVVARHADQGCPEAGGDARDRLAFEFRIQEPFRRDDTVTAMMANQIGDLVVQEMRSPQPARSKAFDLFPGMPHKWGFSFDVNQQPGPHGRSAGSAAWAGAMNTHYWIDPVKRVTGALFTQVWPFFDERVVALFNAFEQGLYQAVERG